MNRKVPANELDMLGFAGMIGLMQHKGRGRMNFMALRREPELLFLILCAHRAHRGYVKVMGQEEAHTLTPDLMRRAIWASGLGSLATALSDEEMEQEALRMFGPAEGREDRVIGVSAR